MFGDIYSNKRVLITGHTGFKGSWLALWLSQIGARVSGYALEPQTNPNHFHLLDTGTDSIIGDIRDLDRLRQVLRDQRPEIVFHLAARAIVRQSYTDPVETYSSNIMGTVNVLEAARECESVRAIVNVTSDKCYENREWIWGYRENDLIGGYDPYSASKGCAELVTSSYRNSFFNVKEYGRAHNILVASARAGNVIGGGDWAGDRLIPDIMRAASSDAKVFIRNPGSTRPWQHVLEPLSGYLVLGQKLLEGRTEYAEAWNFGPDDESNITVERLLNGIKNEWDKVEYEIKPDSESRHEAGLLKLDCSKARVMLNWKPVWDINKCLAVTAQWYKEFYLNGKLMSRENLSDYLCNRSSDGYALTGQR